MIRTGRTASATGAGLEAEWAVLLADQIRLHSRLFFRLAYGIVRDEAAAEDACQAALLKAWSVARHEMRDPARLRAWISRVVVNESLVIARRRRTERRTIGRRPHVRSGPDATAASPAAAALDLRESLVGAMERLPETTRLVVALRVMQGMSGNDVKDLLGCSAAEVSRHLHGGMRQLRDLLADWSDER